MKTTAVRVATPDGIRNLTKLSKGDRETIAKHSAAIKEFLNARWWDFANSPSLRSRLIEPLAEFRDRVVCGYDIDACRAVAVTLDTDEIHLRAMEVRSWFPHD